MKLILLATILSLALANTLYFRAPFLAKHDSGSAPECITEYLTSFWAHFGLKQPSQALNCFDDKSAKLWFKHIFEFANLVQDEEHRERVNVHLDLVKLILLDKGLEHVHACVAQTQDFTDLLKALNIDGRDPERGWLNHYIYLQGNFGKLAGELPQVTGALSNKHFAAAGDLAANVMNTSVTDIQNGGISLIALNGLWNGVHIALGLPDAHSVYSCWNNDTAALRLEFVYGLANAVASGNANEAVTNTQNWYNQTGNALIEKIPKSAWQCWANSTDTKSESDILKVDITSSDFHQKMANFVNNHQSIYWGLQKAIKKSLEGHNFLHAGSAYGHLMQAAVASN